MNTEPLYCSQGGVPYNKAHLDAKDAEIRRLREERRKWQEASVADRAENKQLRDLLECALDEHDGKSGKFAPDFMPDHWTHEARRRLAQ